MANFRSIKFFCRAQLLCFSLVLFLTRSAYSQTDSPAQTEASFQPPSVSIEEIVVVSQQTFSTSQDAVRPRRGGALCRVQ